MKTHCMRIAVAVAAALVTPWAAAEDGVLSAEDFKAFIAKPFVAVSMQGGEIRVELQPEARAVASGVYNDVGTWKLWNADGYCVVWNKRRAEERCSRIVRREGRLAILNAEGALSFWVKP